MFKIRNFSKAELLCNKCFFIYEKVLSRVHTILYNTLIFVHDRDNVLIVKVLFNPCIHVVYFPNYNSQILFYISTKECLSWRFTTLSVFFWQTNYIITNLIQVKLCAYEKMYSKRYNSEGIFGKRMATLILINIHQASPNPVIIILGVSTSSRQKRIFLKYIEWKLFLVENIKYLYIAFNFL